MITISNRKNEIGMGLGAKGKVWHPEYQSIFFDTLDELLPTNWNMREMSPELYLWFEPWRDIKKVKRPDHVMDALKKFLLAMEVAFRQDWTFDDLYRLAAKWARLRGYE